MARPQGTFDELNDALFAQMDRLAGAADEEAVEREIGRSEAVSKLAGNIIANTKAAIDLVRMQRDAGMDVAGMVAEPPRMLGGGK